MLSRYEQFTYIISSIHRHIQKIERDVMIQYGYKGSYAQYLAAMSRYPEGLTATVLGEICDKDKAAVSRAVSEMEERSLSRRETDSDSFYRARLYLTEDGQRAAAYVLQKAQAVVEEVGKALSDDERALFYALLDRISGRLESVSKDGVSQS